MGRRWRWTEVGEGGGGAGVGVSAAGLGLGVVCCLVMAGGKSSQVTLLRSLEPDVGLCRLRLRVEGNMMGDEIGLSVWWYRFAKLC